MAINHVPSSFVLVGEPYGESCFRLRTEQMMAIDDSFDLVLDATQIEAWLLRHSCEFCAHQVKLRLPFRCDHLSATLPELFELGLTRREIIGDSPSRERTG